MPELKDWKEEQFCRLVACNVPRSEAYRETYKTKAQSSSIWSMSSVLASKCAERIQELRSLLRGITEQEWIASKEELLAYLTRAIRTPLDCIDESSDLAQEVKIIETPDGTVTKHVKTVNRLGAAAQIANVAQYGSPTSITNITNNTLNITEQPRMQSAIAALAERFALPAAKVVDMEKT